MIMSMIPIVQHKNWNGDITFERAVRDDLVNRYVACIHCRGRGYGSTYGTYGYGLPFIMYICWELRCESCRGAGAWKVPDEQV